MQSVFESYPELIAIIVLILGIILARLLGKMMVALLSAADERFARHSVSGQAIVSPSVIRHAQTVTFWFVTVLAVIVALSFLDIKALTVAVDGLLIFSGRLLLGLAIVALGHLLGVSARAAIVRFAGDDQTYLLSAKLVHMAILVVAAIMALGQLDIDTSLITQLLVLGLAALLGGLALAFANGARDHVANLLARQDLRRYAIGERIVVGDHEGIVIAIHATSVDLETRDGIASIPAAEFSRSTIVRLVGRTDE